MSQLGRGLTLVGGGDLLIHIAQWALSARVPIRVLTDPRHAQELLASKKHLRDELQDLEIHFCEVVSLDDPDVKHFLGGHPDDLGLSLGAGWIFSQSQIQALFPGGLLNVHGTPLPLYRGGGGFSWQIMAGDRQGAITIHVIDGGIDTGAIVFREDFRFPSTCLTPADYQEYYIEQVLKVVPGFLKSIIVDRRRLEFKDQAESLSTYWPRLSTDLNGWVNWSWSAENITNFIRAFDKPYPGASTFLHNQRVRLRSAFINTEDGPFHPFQRGLIYRKRDGIFSVAAGDAAVNLTITSDLTGESMPPEAKLGDRLETPFDILERALTRPRYRTANSEIQVYPAVARVLDEEVR